MRIKVGVALICIGVCILLGIRVSQDARSRNVSTQAIQCAEMVKDFGERYLPVESVEHTFTLKNGSSAPVEVAIVARSCACTKAELSKKRFEPGETGALVVSWRVPMAAGNHLVRVALQEVNASGHPEGDAIDFGMKMIVRDRFIVEPRPIVFAGLRAGERREIAVNVISQAVAPFAKESVTALIQRGPFEMTANVRDVTAGRVVVDVTAVGTEEPGTALSMLRIGTGDARQPFLEVPIEIDCLGEYEAIPKAVIIQYGRDDLAKVVEVLKHTSGDMLNVERVECDHPDVIECKLSVQNSNRCIVAISAKKSVGGVSNGDASPRLVGAVRIHLGERSEPIAVRYVVLR